jgi:hypothetical protein
MARKRYSFRVVCARILNCKPSQLREKLAHTGKREELIRRMPYYISSKKMHTTYKDRKGEKREFKFGGITEEGADAIKAFGRLSRPFNMSVVQYFYAKHGIRLQFPYLPCVIERFPVGAEDYNYPMELVEMEMEEQQFYELPMPCWFTPPEHALHLFGNLSLGENSSQNVKEKANEEEDPSLFDYSTKTQIEMPPEISDYVDEEGRNSLSQPYNHHYQFHHF